MAVRPWENRFLDMNLKDGVMICENESAETNNGSKSQIKSSGKKPLASNLHSNLSSQKTGPSQSDGSSSSPGISQSMLEASTAQIAKPKSKPPLEDLIVEGNSRPAGIGARSHSNPKERSTQSDKPGKKRLSLPNNGRFLLSLFPIDVQSSRLFIWIDMVESGKRNVLLFSVSVISYIKGGD